MRRLTAIFALALALLTACESETARLKRVIRNDALIDQVDSMARAVASSGFSAGNVYKEVWIRDFNTFIELSLEVMPEAEVVGALDTFFDFQGEDGAGGTQPPGGERFDPAGVYLDVIHLGASGRRKEAGQGQG